MTRFARFFVLALGILTFASAVPAGAYTWEEGCTWNECPPEQPPGCDGITICPGHSVAQNRLTITQH